jgi:hypothetical protein
MEVQESLMTQYRCSREDKDMKEALKAMKDSSTDCLECVRILWQREFACNVTSVRHRDQILEAY